VIITSALPCVECDCVPFPTGIEPIRYGQSTASELLLR